MIQSQFIIVQAVKTRDNELIPLWDKRISIHHLEEMGNIITFDDLTRPSNDRQFSYLTECIFDIKTKTLSPGIEINHYPDLSKLSHKKGDTVLFEIRSSSKELVECQIDDIIFEIHDLYITRGEDIREKAYIDPATIENFSKKDLYAVKHWKPTYVLSNGEKTHWNHQLFRKAKTAKTAKNPIQTND